MTESELNSIEIKQWASIRSEYECPDLLLGNGFSINLWQKFAYKSLFDTFIEKVNEPFKSLFQHFKTTNFELILSHLIHAEKVNSLLNFPTDLIIEAIEILKNGLIKTIEEIHPRNDEVDWSNLDIITEDLSTFKDIYTTNYDLFLYHIIMKSVDKGRDDKSYTPYQDYFRKSKEVGFTEFNRTCLGDKNVYYLHGALFLFGNGIYDLKIQRQSDDLIGTISKKIKQGHFPLFITDGTAEDKENSINRSNYLHFCLQKLSESTTPLLIFGNSLSEFDTHILKALKFQPRDLIISIYTKDMAETQLQSELYSIKNKFLKYQSRIVFVDSAGVFSYEGK
jgi:hypothetical protein